MRRFGARGVMWRRSLNWGVLNVPIWLEPVVLGTWTLLFLFWGEGRRAVMSNLAAIKPGSSALINLLRTYRVMWNFGWTLVDNARFRVHKTIPDWEFADLENFQRLCSHEGGAIILTAHMGSYDLGAYVFSEMCARRMVIVRAPEIDSDTQAYEEQIREGEGSVKVDFNTKAEDLAFELLQAIQNGEIVAIQGDRATRGIATLPARLFGRQTEIPAGPFALAMAARVPIFPLFVVRRGRRRYRLITLEPIVVERTSRQRDDDMRQAIEQWSAALEQVIRDSWYQWFSFEPYAAEAA
jgi:predicted LPLAT superfamily acyltransferase